MPRWDGVLETLVAERRSQLVGYAYVLCGDRAEAEDLVHDAIVRTFSRARRLSDVGHAEGYVKRTIRTQFLNGRRHESVVRRTRHLVAVPDAQPADSRLDDFDDLRRALASLAPRERACVLLRYYDGCDTAETAAELGIATGTVKRYLHNAVERLRALLGDAGPEGEPAVEVDHVRRMR